MQLSNKEFKRLARELKQQESNSSSVLLLTIVTLVIVMIMWASVTELDNVTRGSGKTVSEVQNQLVQSAEPGVIRKRYVEEGDLVRKGELLFDIDPIDAKTQLDQAQKRYATLLIKAVRLRAEKTGVTPTFDDDLVENSPDAVTTELALFRARLDDLNTKLAILNQKRIQKMNEISENEIKFDTAVNSLRLIQREIDTVEPLVKAGLAAETRLINLQREAEQNKGTASAAESAKKRLVSGLDEIDEELKAANQTYITRALTDLSQIEGEISELLARIPALQSRVDRTSVKSPVDGVINQLNYVTADAYVSTGDVLLEIVPTGFAIIVEAKINPKDRPDVSIGQDVKISLTSYDPTRYGRLDGVVEGVSADALTNQQTGEQFYQVDINITGSLFEDDGSEVVILPGMEASIDVLSGKRTILEYFWQPIAKVKDRAFRD